MFLLCLEENVDVLNGVSFVKNLDYMKEVLYNMFKFFVSGSNCIFGENVFVICEEYEFYVIYKSLSYLLLEVLVL